MNLSADSLYKEIIIEHYKNPNNLGLLPNLKTYTIKNAVCGDIVSIQIEANNGLIYKVYQKGSGCAISRASTSIMTQELKGKTIDEAIDHINNFVKMLKNDTSVKEDKFEDAIVFKGIKDYPARFKCASISWEAAINALQELKK